MLHFSASAVPAKPLLPPEEEEEEEIFIVTYSYTQHNTVKLVVGVQSFPEEQ